MSVATLDDNFDTQDLKTESEHVHAERTRILDMVSRKAQDQTLTLQETTALYEKFNSTYSAYRSNEPHAVDESWALELLEECEQEDIEQAQENASFQTRINGIPHESKQKVANTDNADTTSANDAVIVVEKSSGDIQPFAAQDLKFDLGSSFGSVTNSNQRHDAFATFVIATSVITLSALLGFAIFF